MSVTKVVEISSESSKSFEDAIRIGIARAEESLKNVRGASISEQNVIVKNGKPITLRVDMKVSFVLV